MPIYVPGKYTGKYYEDFIKGKTYITPGRTITEADITNFACLTWDSHSAHTDEEFARKTIFGKRAAHGLLILSFTMGLLTKKEDFGDTLAAFSEINWKFIKSVCPGDTIYVKACMVEKRSTRRNDVGFVAFDIEVYNQNDEQVCKGVFKIMVEKKDGHR